ncbi:hypothetical protein HPB52_010613 [Rhipicephalus sanguineus]|uniref:Uncharacterized protein n=1 Tax=Rhipicephalus sanguineus TaxID=34632 RepID=A0A9D4T241_RHISA|nr:hypothetical protein HPB52_010613 [Rhipicephalus sanguineus]
MVRIPLVNNTFTLSVANSTHAQAYLCITSLTVSGKTFTVHLYAPPPDDALAAYSTTPSTTSRTKTSLTTSRQAILPSLLWVVVSWASPLTYWSPSWTLSCRRGSSTTVPSFASFGSATKWKPASIAVRPATGPMCAPSRGRNGAIVAPLLTPHRPKDRCPLAPSDASSATGITPHTAPTANTATCSALNVRRPWYLTLAPRHLVRPQQPRDLPSKLQVLPHHFHPQVGSLPFRPSHQRYLKAHISPCIRHGPVAPPARPRSHMSLHFSKKTPPTAAYCSKRSNCGSEDPDYFPLAQLQDFEEKLESAITVLSFLPSPIHSFSDMDIRTLKDVLASAADPTPPFNFLTFLKRSR